MRLGHVLSSIEIINILFTAAEKLGLKLIFIFTSHKDRGVRVEFMVEALQLWSSYTIKLNYRQLRKV
ncbi:uncharacterized protein LOC108035150 isoform X2 [Drosophila biarmipes]|uniref:uncharacterized protein LOC108035150 isoform X2 n=1 Tax=Drosophila biarmipes TaxID=125945 RepID=UPI0021CCFED5|nr:uncharacterized protein LOC108035150 isoform X2 [Drosophila biarmipes]